MVCRALPRAAQPRARARGRTRGCEANLEYDIPQCSRSPRSTCRLCQRGVKRTPSLGRRVSAVKSTVGATGYHVVRRNLKDLKEYDEYDGKDEAKMVYTLYVVI